LTARITVSHFGGRQSFPLVEALNDAGMLDRFLTGFYLTRSSAGWLSRAVPRLGNYVLDTPAGKARMPSLSYVAYKLALPWVAENEKRKTMWRFLSSFDLAVARRLPSIASDIFIGFEYSSLESFRKARNLGCTTVLEASSVHYSYQAQALRGTPIESQVLATIPRKQQEIELADHIVVLSSFAKRTYLDAGIEEGRITVIAPYVSPLGGASSPSRQSRDRESVRFLYAGNLGHHKGSDLLLEAFRALAFKEKELRMVGGRIQDAPANVEVIGRVPRERLADHFAWADYFVLPSRFDGYGFVVAEAMRMGVPVIVSDAVGAADLVSPGQNGWIFKSGDAGSLHDAMERAVSARDAWTAMSRAAPASAATLTRERYVERVIAAYNGIASGRRP